MRKIITLFKRNYDGNRLVYNEVTPGAEWVINGEGVATIKLDGTCCMIKDGKLFKRHDVKKGKDAPDGFIPAQDPDETTGHWPGWLLVGDGPEDKWHREGFRNTLLWIGYLADGTFELIGPKINNNSEGYNYHCLARHGVYIANNCPRTFGGLKEWLKDENIEGIVWHHPDGRMVKIKKKDFGFKRSLS